MALNRLAAAALVLFATAAASAQEQPPGTASPVPPPAETTPPLPPPGAGSAAEDGFALSPATGDHLKIDRRTGRVSVCSSRTGTWLCTLIPDDRAAFEEELAALQAENERLKSDLSKAREEIAALSKGGEWFGPDEKRKLDEFMAFSDHAMRRFFDMVQDLKRDLEAPDRI